MKNNHGFTFIELMIAISIMSIVFITMFSVFITQFRLYTGQNKELELAADSNRCLRVIQDVVEDHKSVAFVSQDILESEGAVIVDMLDDGNNLGSHLNLDGGILYDEQDIPVCEDIHDVTFVLGPDNSRNMYVADGVLMIKISMKDDNILYTLDGGVHLGK